MIKIIQNSDPFKIIDNKNFNFSEKIETISNTKEINNSLFTFPIPNYSYKTSNKKSFKFNLENLKNNINKKYNFKTDNIEKNQYFQNKSESQKKIISTSTTKQKPILKTISTNTEKLINTQSIGINTESNESITNINLDNFRNFENSKQNKQINIDFKLMIFLLINRIIIFRTRLKEILNYQIDKEHYKSVYNLLAEAIYNKFKVDNPPDDDIDLTETSGRELNINVDVSQSFAKTIYKRKYQDHTEIDQDLLLSIYCELYPQNCIQQTNITESCGCDD